MKIYILFREEGNDRVVVAAYTTRPKAEAALRVGFLTNKKTHYIQEAEVDPNG